MLAKASSSFALIGLLILGALLVFSIALPSSARAQCGDIKSSCAKCHQAEDPAYSSTEWHALFGHQYACWNCHGGNDVAQDKAPAHDGLVRNPLEDSYTSCYACHPEDYQARAEQLAKTIGVAASFHGLAARPSP